MPYSTTEDAGFHLHCIGSLRKQLSFHNATTGFYVKKILVSAPDRLCRMGNLLQPIRSTTWIWVGMRHHYEFSALVSKASVHRETSGSVTKCWLFSQDYLVGIAVTRPLRCKLSFGTCWCCFCPTYSIKSEVFKEIITYLSSTNGKLEHRDN